MNEWLKILAGGVVGVAVGVLLEPVKLYFKTRHEVRILENIILKELAEYYVQLEEFIEYSETEPPYHVERRSIEFQSPAYALANEQKLIFHQIDNSEWLERVYRSLWYLGAETTGSDRLWKAKAARTEMLKLKNSRYWRRFKSFVPSHVRPKLQYGVPLLGKKQP